MSVVYDRFGVQVHQADCLAVLKGMADESVDSVVTDPPAGISFMGREWDSARGGRGQWVAWLAERMREALRVLKPGGHALVWALPRTSHWTALALEDAGFEIRDCIVHLNGAGFPKSKAVSRDPIFCQCLSDVFETATADATESDSTVLLSNMRGCSEAVPTHSSELPSMSRGVHASGSSPSGAEQDVLIGMCSEKYFAHENRAPLGEGPAHDAAVRRVWNTGEAVPVSTQASSESVLLTQLPSNGARSDAAGQCVRRDRDDQATPLRSGQSSVEGRGDLQAAEGELHRTQVREVPTGSPGDGAGGWLCDGTPTGDGSLGRSGADQGGMCQSHRPESAEQRPLEPRAVSDERGSQAGRGWPVCAGCGKPRVPRGLGTALKPAGEHWWLVRKPVRGTVAGNVLEHGTGALNISGCTVAAAGRPLRASKSGASRGVFSDGLHGSAAVGVTDEGRWPPNVVLSHGALLDPDTGEVVGDACVDGCVAGCAVAELDNQSGNRPAGGALNGLEPSRPFRDAYGDRNGRRVWQSYGDSGGASRFFPVFRWEPKAPPAERPRVNGEAHPTVKSLGLMRWLVRLVTPPGGLVVDMFAGSGPTGQAARAEGMRAVLIEADAKHIPFIRARLDAHPRTEAARPDAQVVVEAAAADLFALLDGDGP